jgi:hypothetical protein
MIRNGIPRICLNFLLHGKEFRVVFSSAECSEWNSESLFYFGSMERNSELYSLLQKGSEHIFLGSLLLFSFNGTEFRVVFSSAEGFGTEFRECLFRGTTGIPSEITNCSAYSVFRGIIFLSEIPNPTLWSSGKIYAYGIQSSGLKKRGSAKLRWAGRVAHLGRRVAQ